jgi:hypothetical protein
MRAVIGWRLATTNIVIILVTGGTAGGAGTVTAIVGSAMDGTGIATTTDAGTDSYSTALPEATINVQAVGGVTEDRWRKMSPLVLAFPMLSDHGLGLDDDECGAPLSPHSAQPSPEEPVEWCQLRLLHRTMQNAELMPKRKVFQLESGSGFED